MATNIELPIAVVLESIETRVKQLKREQEKYKGNLIIHDALQKQISTMTAAMATAKETK